MGKEIDILGQELKNESVVPELPRSTGVEVPYREKMDEVRKRWGRKYKDACFNFRRTAAGNVPAHFMLWISVAAVTASLIFRARYLPPT